MQKGQNMRATTAFVNNKQHHKTTAPRKHHQKEEEQTLWDALMESRIRLQRALTLANRLPQPGAWQLFVEDEETKELMEKAAKATQQLLYLYDDMAVAQWNRNQELVNQCGPATALPRTDPADTDALWQAMQQRDEAFLPYENGVLDKWHQRTQVGFAAGKKFKAVNQGVVQQIEQVLQDRGRLLRRSQTHRSVGRVLGKPVRKAMSAEEAAAAAAADSTKTEAELVEEAQRAEEAEKEADVDPEIYDDTDFYGELLRELIQSSQRSATAAQEGDGVLAATELNRLRSSTRKKKKGKLYSKGRRVKYDVMPELVNFTAPVGAPDGAQAKAADWDTAQLFAHLFGGNAAAPAAQAAGN